MLKDFDKEKECKEILRENMKILKNKIEKINIFIGLYDCGQRKET